MKYFELQPLRIPAGWTVKYNNFTEYDPQEDEPEYRGELSEDLLGLEHANLLIDLGWYPAMDLNGSYALYLVDKTRKNPFADPLELFQTKFKKEIIAKLEYWMNAGHYRKYVH